jgi:hypothetical protein
VQFFDLVSELIHGGIVGAGGGVLTLDSVGERSRDGTEDLYEDQPDYDDARQIERGELVHCPSSCYRAARSG